MIKAELKDNFFLVIEDLIINCKIEWNKETNWASNSMILLLASHARR